MFAALLALFVGFIVLPVILVASIGRGGPILWVGGIVLVCWLGETVIERLRSRAERRLADASCCLGCGHQLIAVQQRCPECDRMRDRPSAADASASAAASASRRRRLGISMDPTSEIRDTHR